MSLAIAGGLLGGGVLAYRLAGGIYQYQDSVQGEVLPQVDAIVCLAGGRGRITAAGDLWRKYVEKAQAQRGSRPGEQGGGQKAEKIPVLYFSGVGAQASWHALARQLRPSVFQGIRLEDVVIERESSNTFTNAQWLARYAHERGWKRILLLTSSYHMKRARFIFERVLKTQAAPIEVETYSVYQEPFDSKGWKNGANGIRVTIFEYLKWVYYQWSM